MKTLIIFFAMSLFAISGMAQEWAPIGASWYYTEMFFGPGIDYIKLQSEKDTIVNGIPCRKITKRHNLVCGDRPSVEFMYENSHKVYFYDTIFNTFQTLYDFNPVVGNSWYIKLKNYGNPGDTDTVFVTVDSIQPMIINGNVLNKFFVTYNFHNEWEPNFTYSGILIERIGDLLYMFNFSPSFGFVCDGNYSAGLRCYDDNVIGHYETGIADSCTYLMVGISPHNTPAEATVSIYPNPVQDILNVQAENCDPSGFRITDIRGVVLKTGKINKKMIDVNDFPRGLYFLEFYDVHQNLLTKQKFIK